MTKHISLKPKPFPKLMICNNMGAIGNSVVVLMSANKKGMVVHITMPEQYGKKVGDYCTTWVTKNFEDYNGKVVIQNDLIHK